MEFHLQTNVIFSSWCNSHQMSVRLIGKSSLEKVVHGNSLQTLLFSAVLSYYYTWRV